MGGASSSAASGLQRPRRRPGENRAGLIAAGTVEFGLLGYAAAQTGAIARRAWVSQPNVYANFASKRELFLACVADVYSSVQVMHSASSTQPIGSASDDVPVALQSAPGGAEALVEVTPPRLSDEQCLLLYQSIAALGDVQLSHQLRPLIAELRAELGEQGFERAILRAIDRLTERE